MPGRDVPGDDGGQRHVLLARHAKAESHGSRSDVDRVLALPGRRQAKALGELLLADGRVPDVVLCSPATRTRQTWQLVAAALGERADGIDVRVPDLLYGADVDDVVDLLRGLPADVRTALVVGHEPVMSAAARALAGPASDEASALRVRTGISTASVAVLHTDRPWPQLGPRTAVLTGLLTAPSD